MTEEVVDSQDPPKPQRNVKPETRLARALEIARANPGQKDELARALSETDPVAASRHAKMQYHLATCRANAILRAARAERDFAEEVAVLPDEYRHMLAAAIEKLST